MAESKIDFSFENLHFSCEGEKDWVEKQLNQVLNRIAVLNKSVPSGKPEKVSFVPVHDVVKDGIKNIVEADRKERGKRGRKSKSESGKAAFESSVDPLFEFLKEKDADKNQVKKFLATAVFLHSRGQEKFSTPMISKSLKSALIEKLINPSDCLNKNEKKGFCIKDDREFILTDAGIRSIIGGGEE